MCVMHDKQENSNSELFKHTDTVYPTLGSKKLILGERSSAYDHLFLLWQQKGQKGIFFLELVNLGNTLQSSVEHMCTLLVYICTTLVCMCACGAVL